MPIVHACVESLSDGVLVAEEAAGTVGAEVEFVALGVVGYL